MDHFDDTKLTETFNTLSMYRTNQKGIEWNDLQADLPKSNMRYRIVYSLVLFILLLTIRGTYFNVSGIVIKINQCSTTADAFKGSDIKIKSPNRSNQSNKSFDDQITQPARQISRQDEMNWNSWVLIDQPLKISRQLNANLKAELTAQPKEIEQASELIDEDTTMMSKQENANSIHLFVEGSYLFGIVDPNSSDPFSISNYKFRPGTGFKLGFDYALLRRTKSAYYVGAFYQIINKPFSFMLTDFSNERVKSTTVNECITQHQVGIELRVIPNNHSWQFSIGAAHSLKNQPNSLFSRNWLSIGLTGRMMRIGDNAILTISGNAAVPISNNENSYLKYYPLQISIGLAKFK